MLVFDIIFRILTIVRPSKIFEKAQKIDKIKFYVKTFQLCIFILILQTIFFE